MIDVVVTASTVFGAGVMVGAVLGGTVGFALGVGL